MKAVRTGTAAEGSRWLVVGGLAVAVLVGVAFSFYFGLVRPRRPTGYE